MASRRLLWLAVLVLLPGCGGGEPPASPATPGPASTAPARGRVFTAADSGFTGRFAVGETAVLRLPPPEGGPEPSATGGAVVLVRIANVAESGHREWEIRAVRTGTSQVSVPRDGLAPATLTFVVH